MENSHIFGPATQQSSSSRGVHDFLVAEIIGCAAWVLQGSCILLPTGRKPRPSYRRPSSGLRDDGRREFYWQRCTAIEDDGKSKFFTYDTPVEWNETPFSARPNMEFS
jgi:hypothetical protein